MKDYEKILDFWFSNREKWFNGGKEFDDNIRKNYLYFYKKAISGDIDTWKDSPSSCLALIIILDQFSRNIFRGKPGSFEYDFKALYLSKLAIKKGFLSRLKDDEKTFIIMPLMHSESLVDQEFCVNLFNNLRKTNNVFEKNYKYALEHIKIIKKFGRFPHRNKILSRESSKKEKDFLKTHNGF